MQRHGRAVVIGSSMVGMCVARAIRGHFDEVLVLEKDALPEAPDHRKGVHQSHHIHNLLLKGAEALEELLPGFRQEALKLGANEVDYCNRIMRRTLFGWMPLFDSDLMALSASRKVIECALRNRFRVLAENITLIEGISVKRPILDPEDPAHVRGVITDHEDPGYARIEADMVFDCAGKGSRITQWLELMRQPAVQETVVDSHCGYSSRFYRSSKTQPERGFGIIIDAKPGFPAWGALAPYEEGTWILTLGGFNHNYPPRDEAAFNAFARDLIAPDIYDTIMAAEPISDIKTSRSMVMRWRHMERYRGKVRGLLALGDSVWQYNPLYGQGMSVGAVSAGILKQQLDQDNDLDTLWKRYYKPAAEFAYPYWESTSWLDMRWKGTEGKRPWYLSMAGRFADHLIYVAHTDDAVCVEAARVAHMLSRPTSLFLNPRVLWGLVKGTLRRALTLGRPPAPARRLEAGQPSAGGSMLGLRGP